MNDLSLRRYCTMTIGIILLLLVAGCETIEPNSEEPFSVKDEKRYEEIINDRCARLNRQDVSSVVINEVSIWNHSELETEDGEFPSWLEIKNNMELPQSIEGWRIKIHDQDGSSLVLPPFPALMLEPDEIKVIAFVPKLSKLPVVSIRVGTDLPKSTIALELLDPMGTSVNLFNLNEVAPYDWTQPSKRDFSQFRRTSLVREILSGCHATPGLENDVIIPSPVFKQDSGFFEEFILQFETSTLPEGYQIVYTINDGQLWDDDVLFGYHKWDYPTLVSGVRYTGPVTLDKTSVVKARVFAPSGACGPLETRTYFIGEKTDLPIVSLTIDPADLWDAVEGIYTEGPDPEDRNYLKKAYRSLHMEYFPDDSSIASVIDGDFPFRIFGYYSRYYPQKSLAIYANSHRKSDLIPNFFFETGSAKDIDSLSAIVMRNSGGDNSRTMFRDALATEITTGYDIEMQDNRAVIAFINGQYWGIYNIREKINEYFLEDHTGMNPQKIDLIEGVYREYMTVNEGDFEKMDELIELIKNYDPKYEIAYNQYGDLIDIDNFIDYMIFQVFINNTDWPWNNTKYWRPRTEDGKWRFILFDTDGCMDTKEYHTSHLPEEGYAHGLSSFDMLSFVSSENNPAVVCKLLARLLRNQEFYDKFIARFEFLLDTHLTSEMFQEKIDEHVGNIEGEIPRHCDRWTYKDEETGEHIKRSFEVWEQEVQVLRDFVDQRIDYIEEYLTAFQERVHPPGLERIENGGFEDEDYSMWNMVWSEDSVNSRILELDGSRVGYLKMIEGEKNPWDAVSYVYDDIFMQTGEILKFSFDVRVNTKLTGDEVLRVKIFEITSHDMIAVKDFIPRTDWNRESMTFTYSGPTIFSGRMQFRVGNLNTGQEMYLDNITLEVVN